MKQGAREDQPSHTAWTGDERHGLVAVGMRRAKHVIIEKTCSPRAKTGKNKEENMQQDKIHFSLDVDLVVGCAFFTHRNATEAPLRVSI